MIQIVKVHEETEEGKEPSRAYPLDVGYDLTITRHIAIQPGNKALLPTALILELPENVFGMILPRSSSLYRRNLFVNTSVLDCGYRGEVQVLAWNIGPKAVYVAEGDKVAQLIILPRMDARFYIVKKLDTPGDRGVLGLGSSDALTPSPL